jgi:plastocyanin
VVLSRTLAATVVAVASFLAWTRVPVHSQSTLGIVRGRFALPAGGADDRRPALVDPRTRPAVRQPRVGVVYLEVAPSAAFEDPVRTRERMDQRNETFVPHILAVRTGTVVDFPNSDRIYHNVFSLSPTRRFDLGRYAVGHSKSIRFDRPGVVRVFCDIHSHMSAFILVFSHRYFAVTQPDGTYQLPAVPAGTYMLAAWFEGEVRANRQVVVRPGETSVADLPVP